MAGIKKFKLKYPNFQYKEERIWVNNHLNQISKDIKRTLTPNISNEQQKEQFYESIKNILLAYTNLNKNVGYVQGMNIIVSCLLYNVCNEDYGFINTYEEQTFWLFAALMEKYQIKLCFSQNMKKVFDLSDSLEFNLQKNQGQVFNHINRSDVNSLA